MPTKSPSIRSGNYEFNSNTCHQFSDLRVRVKMTISLLWVSEYDPPAFVDRLESSVMIAYQQQLRLGREGEKVGGKKERPRGY